LRITVASASAGAAGIDASLGMLLITVGSQSSGNTIAIVESASKRVVSSAASSWAIVP